MVFRTCIDALIFKNEISVPAMNTCIVLRTHFTIFNDWITFLLFWDEFRLNRACHLLSIVFIKL